MATKSDHVISLIGAVRAKAHRLIVAELEKRRIRGIGPSHGNILNALYEHGGPLRMSELGLTIKRDKSTITALVNKLIDNGYVEKLKDPEDGRASLIRLTPKGEAFKSHFDEISRVLIERVFANMSSSEQETLIRLLTKTAENL